MCVCIWVYACVYSLIFDLWCVLLFLRKLCCVKIPTKGGWVGGRLIDGRAFIICICAIIVHLVFCSVFKKKDCSPKCNVNQFVVNAPHKVSFVTDYANNI